MFTAEGEAAVAHRRQANPAEVVAEARIPVAYLPSRTANPSPSWLAQPAPAAPKEILQPRVQQAATLRSYLEAPSSSRQMADREDKVGRPAGQARVGLAAPQARTEASTTQAPTLTVELERLGTYPSGTPGADR